jgi:hypothetical protein
VVLTSSVLARIGARLGLPASTLHAVLARYRCPPPLAHHDCATRRRIRRYEQARPGELAHVGVKKTDSPNQSLRSRGRPRARGTPPTRRDSRAITLPHSRK